MKIDLVYLGIDISKRTLHLATPEKFLREFDNTPTGCRSLLKRIQSLDYAGVVLEASGGYERRIVELLQDHDIPISVAQPACVRHYAKSIKVLAKTDAIDAQVIARYAQAVQPGPTAKTPANVRKIRAFRDRRDQIVQDRVREENRLEACDDREIAESIQAQVERLRKIEKNLDRQILDFLKSDPTFQRKLKIMTGVIGVAHKTAATLLAHFPELGTLTRGQVAALAGVAPHANESGTYIGKRRIYGGRAAIRKAMYMAARTAVRYCPVMSEFYERLRSKGKPFKVAIIACARKMLIRLNTLLSQLEAGTKMRNEAPTT